MTLAQQYAKALAQAQREHPKSSAKLIEGLKEALARRGHQTLLPRVYAEYEKLQLRKSRVPEVTPEKERTRTLLQLYRHLTRHA